MLSGRGGAINSHVGNTHFREWVRVRKERYNLARTKAEKARVANEVMDLVKGQNPPGRFLQRDTSSVTGGVTWWTEVDEIKAMAKTSQALREGAPSIRAAHKDELQDTKKRARKSTKKPDQKNTGKRSHPEAETTLRPQPNFLNAPMPPLEVPALEMSKTQAIEQLKANVEAAQNSEPTSNPIQYTASNDYSYGPTIKRSRMSENLYLPSAGMQQQRQYQPPQYTYQHQSPPQPHIVKPDDETPPLMPMPSPVPLSAIPELGDNFPQPSMPKRDTSLRRANSLALSDIGNGLDNWGDLEFINPFTNEAECEELANSSSTINAPGLPLFPEQQSPQTYSPGNSSGNGSGAPRSARNSLGNTSVKSLASDLSDLVDTNVPSSGPAMNESEFGEGMKAVYDAVHPGLTSPSRDEPIPTHLYPYRAGSLDLRRSDSISAPQLIC